MVLVVRTATEPQALIAALRREVRAVDKDLPLANIATLEQLLGKTVAQRRLTMLLLGAFAAVALALAALGVYGLMSYAVAQRQHEMGIRLALGARAADVIGLIVGEGMALALLGLALGLAAALGLTRLMASLLFGVTPGDPATFAAVALLLTLVALLACWLPAWRAAKVDPLVALRYE
jgi:putative ABC transport system permease protein